MRLVELVARHYRANADELEQMKGIARADPDAAWECLTLTVKEDGIAP
jgi:hypothetical protein